MIEEEHKREGGLIRMHGILGDTRVGARLGIGMLNVRRAGEIQGVRMEEGGDDDDL